MRAFMSFSHFSRFFSFIFVTIFTYLCKKSFGTLHEVRALSDQILVRIILVEKTLAPSMFNIN